MNRNRVITGIVLVVIVGVAVTVFALHNSGAHDVAALPTPSPFTTANAQTLETALGSRNQAVQAKALIPGLRQGDWQPNEVLPQGATLKIDQSSFKQDGNEASVTATVTGKAQGTFVLRLMLVDGQWLISSTE